MESLKLKMKYKALQNALLTLQEVLTNVDALIKCVVDVSIIRDSTIKRFEYSIDIFWKFLKLYIEEVQKIDVKVATPKEVLKFSLQYNMITNEEHEVLMRAVTDRNLTSHTYNQELANKIFTQIPLYFVTMQSVMRQLRV